MLFRSAAAAVACIVLCGVVPAPAQAAPPSELGETKGKLLWVDFWASWCAPCRVEQPALKDLAKRPGITLYGVAYKDTPEKARAFLDELGNPFARIVADVPGRAAIDWGVTGVPETFVIDGLGVIRQHYSGALSDDDLRNIASLARF